MTLPKTPQDPFSPAATGAQVIDTKHWLRQAQRIDAEDEYTYADLARELVADLGWSGALNVATALRSHVYSQPGGSELHVAVRPIYEALGWEQAALLAAWFRNADNRP